MIWFAFLTGKPFLETIALDDETTEAKPVTYLNYGPFSTGAPAYDSSFSTLTKEETDLLLSYYGKPEACSKIRTAMLNCAALTIELYTFVFLH